MPIPALTTEGYLPSGEHMCNLLEIEEAFCHNDHRTDLLDKLRRFVTWLREHHTIDLPYFVDGSYTTAKEHPSDIDFVLDLTHANDQQIGAALTLFTLHQAQIKEDYKVDFWFYHPDAEKNLKHFFQYVRAEELQQKQLPRETRKGILRVRP